MFTLAGGLLKVLPTKANAVKLLGRFNRRDERREAKRTIADIL